MLRCSKKFSRWNDPESRVSPLTFQPDNLETFLKDEPLSTALNETVILTFLAFLVLWNIVDNRAIYTRKNKTRLK